MPYALRAEIDVASDVQIVGTSSAWNRDEVGPVDCAFCNLNLNKLSLTQRQNHYDQHLKGDSNGNYLSSL